MICFGTHFVVNRAFSVKLFAAVTILSATAISWAQDDKGPTAYKFSFGSGKPESGYTQVSPTAVYSKEVGYGFEPDADVKAVDRGGNDPLRSGYCTSDKPFYFSVAVPEGNYKVTVTLGDPAGESDTTIKAELRRLMLESVRTKSGELKTCTFVVNVRRPQIAGGGSVKLNARETSTETWAWDDKLTLEFNGTRPCLYALEIAPIDNFPTIYLLGDSTVCDQSAEPWNSWGQMLPRFFQPVVAVANHSESGESLRGALGKKRLDKILSTMKQGDYLFIQFGHNDMKEKGEGVGAFTTYKTDLKRFVAATKQHGGTPVLVTSVNRKKFDEAGKVVNTLGDYPEAVRQVAKEENVPLIDLQDMSKQLYEAIGAEKIDQLFVDGTHHNNFGSYELAKCIVRGIKQSQLDLAKFLVVDAPEFDPNHPDPIEDFHIPASPKRDPAKPLGN